MGRLLGRIGVRTGVAIGLILLVLGVVALARMVGDARTPLGLPETALTSTVDPTVGDDGVVDPTPSPHPDDADLRVAARDFATAWLRRELDGAAWHEGIARLATTALAQSLADVEPRTVPASTTTGPPAIVLRTDVYAVVTVPVDTGTLRLSLLRDSGRWLVDGIDWERA